MLLCQRERLVSGDLVLPGGLIGVHGSVDHIDKVAFEDASGATGTFGGLLAGDEFLRGRAEAFLHDGGRIENAVEAAVASPVKGGDVRCRRNRPGLERSRCSGPVWPNSKTV
jgi:hypothetical protein